MASKRPETLEEIGGQDSLVKYVRNKINQGIFPQVTMWSGEEGLGKSSLTKLAAMAIHCESPFKPCYECSTCRDIAQRVIREEKDNDYVKVFNMSVNGGKEAVNEAIASLNTAFSSNGKRVIIFEECHRMSDEAMDALNLPLEKLPKGVYAMFLTTDELRLSKAILSRMVPLYFKRPTRKEMIQILKADATYRKLNIQGGDTVFDLIATWAENKPRAALSILEGMGNNCNVSYEEVKDFLNVIDMKNIIPLISSLNGSILIGMNSILELPMDKKTHSQLTEILVEAIKLKENQMSYRVGNEDARLLREAVQDIDMNRLVTFVYNVTSLPELSKQGLIAAYLKGHPYVTNVVKHKPEILEEELSVKTMNTTNVEASIERPMIPSMNELINRGSIIRKE